MKNLALFLFLLCIAQLSFSQDYELSHYTVEDGLMSNDVRDIFQDSLGVIWVENGLGFTKFYGDKIENITGLKNEEWAGSFQISNGRIFNNEYYYASSSNALKSRFRSNPSYKNEKYNYIIGLWKDSRSNALNFVKSDSPKNDEFGNQYYFKIHEKDTSFYQVDFYEKDTINLSALINQKRSFLAAELMQGGFDSKGNYRFITKEKEVFVYSPHTNTLDSFPGINGFVNFFELEDGRFALHLKKEVKNTSLMLTTTNQDGSIGQEPIQEFNSYLVVYNKQKSKITDSVKLGKWSQWGSGLDHKVDKGNADWFLHNGNTLIKIKEGKLEEKIVSNEEILDYEFNSSNTLMYLIKRYGKTILVSKSQEYELSFPSDRFFIDKQDNLFFPTNPGFYKLTPSNYEFKEWVDFKGKSKNVERLYSWIPNQYIIDSLNRKVELLFKAPFIYGLTNDSLFLIQELENYRGNSASFLKYKNNLYCEIMSTIIEKSYLLKIDSILNVKQFELNGPINFILNKEVLSFVNERGIYAIESDVFHTQKSWSDSLNIERVLPHFSYKQATNDFSRQAPIALKFREDSTYQTILYNPKSNKLNPYENESLKKILHSPASLGNSKWFSFTIDKLLMYNRGKITSLKNGVFNYLEGMSLTCIQDKYSNVYLGGDNGLGLAFIPSSLDTIYKLKPETDPEFFNRDFRDITLSEDSNKLWMLSNQGLHSLDLEKFNQSGTMDLENFITPETQGYKIQSIGDSILMNFNVDGIAYLKIGDNRFIPSAPQIHFTSLRKDYNIFNWTNTTNKIDSSYGNNMPYNMSLSHEENHLTFDYQGVSHSNKKPLVYFHKLVGLDTNFVGTLSKSATYSNLEPGDYTFKVFTQDENDTASEIIECSFSIAPPFWETWWFISLCILAIGSTAYSSYQYNIRRLKARQAELEQEVETATVSIRNQKNEIEKQRDEIEETHKEITDSIAYAKRIQSAILPPLKLVKEYLQESFVLYKPKDVVAGDFYWMLPKANDGSTLFAAADCTGHGVPGAMVSVVCNSALNRAVKEFNLSEPGEILTKTRDLVIEEFEKSDEEVKDGMDIALCSLRTSSGAEKTAILKFAGAYNPLWIIRNGATEVEEIKAHKQAIGLVDNPEAFPTHEIQLNEGDAFYIFSDGYVDQFGGERGKKYKAPNFRRLLVSMQDKSMEEQHQLIGETFEKWRGSLEQIDDVCIIGVRI